MKVYELIEILESLKNQDANIQFKDSAAGNREIEKIDDFLEDLDLYSIIGKRTKRK